jgi:CheY-like chemotaxis protein
MLFGLAKNHHFHNRLQSIEQQVMSGANLTRQLLGFAQGEKYEVKSIDLNELLEKSSEMFGRAKKGISISKILQRNIWPVEADQGQIEQVLLNMFINAAQAMSDEGEIDLETGNMELTDGQAMLHGVRGGRYVKISITDTGVGMDEATLLRIFEPFFTTKGPGMGTGLGLASAYGIIKNHDGFITVYSKPGQGTTFNIHLPATATDITPIDEESDTLVRGHETILIIDDEPIYLTVKKQALETLGYRVFTAGSGQEAIAVFMEKQSQIDLAILDMIMPGMGGRKTFMALRAINPDLKIIIASGYSISLDVQQLMDKGCNGFIQKPYGIQELSKIIRKVI